MGPEKKKILFGPLPPPYGGVAVFMAALHREASARGFSVWNYTGKAEVGSRSARFVDHRRLGHIWALLQEGRQARITDSTHFHLEYPHPVLLPLWVAAKRLLRFRWIKVLHDGSLPERYASFGYLRRRLLKMALGNIDEIAASSPELVDWLENELAYKGKISAISTLAEVPDFANVKTDPQLTARLADLSSADPIVSSVGVFIPSYGFDDVAVAVEKVRSDLGRNISLLLVDGEFADEPAYRRQVLEGRDWIVTFESLPHELLPNILKKSDVFVRPFKNESVGLSRIEAIFWDVPVVATNVGETRGMLTYEYGDTETLATHIRSILAGDRPATDQWRSQYLREAAENRERYLQLITGMDGSE